MMGARLRKSVFPSRDSNDYYRRKDLNQHEASKEQELGATLSIRVADVERFATATGSPAVTKRSRATLSQSF
jgi:hypothetical protein